MPLQIPYTCCVPLHLPAHPPGKVSALCPDVPRSPTLPMVGTQSCRAFWGRWLVGRTTAAQPGPGQSRSPAAVAECWLERVHRRARRLGALPSSSRGLYSTVCFINKSNHIQSQQDELCRFLQCPRSGTEAAREGLMPGAQEQGAQGSPTMGDDGELSAWPQPGISSRPSELHPQQAKRCPQHPTTHHRGEIWGWGWRGPGLPSCCQEPGASGLLQGQRLGAEMGEKAGWAHSPSFLATLGSKQQAAAPQDDPCERVWELLLARIQALLGQQHPFITPELTKTSSVALVCGTEPSATAPPAQDGCALPVPWQGWSWGHREPRLLLLVPRGSGGTGGLLVVPAWSWHPHSVIFPGSAPLRSSSVSWCSPGRPDTTANL